jgi:polar amino acid transport system substrate-binding protein
MPKFGQILSLIFTLLLVGGCNTLQATDETGNSPVLSRIEQRGELILGTAANMAPMTYTRDDGKVVGLDIDLARLMAASMEVKLTIKTMQFADLLPALKRGEVDVVISNMTITPKRNMHTAFVGPYMTSGKCIITREESIARAEEAENLNTPETRMAVMKGSTSEDFLRVLLPDATVITTASDDEAIQLVRDDKVGGVLTDYPICLSTVKNHPDDGFVPLFSLLNYEPIGIALPGNDPLFVNWTENFLERADGTGILGELGERWFGDFGDVLNAE